VGEVHADNRHTGDRAVSAAPATKGFLRAAETPLYAVDALVRRAAPLQQTADADVGYAHLAPDDAKRLKLAAGDKLNLRHDGARLTLPVKLDDSIAAGEVWVPAGLVATLALGPMFAAVELEKA
ncbi:MAG TPA: molybdopterin dinucleotide binding domain-containing protein, partial [Gammaproteobacteria bacterium]|nr:molybdopterin dinucleotide binding domain-containing protein [Gammaproteobacteria bacterium]